MRNCKHCKYLRISIVPPSNQQWCSRWGKYVDIRINSCEDFIHDTELQERFENGELI
ncbi:hypothetical protein [uncultured Methanobrevibacter sp.]|uniref:hypothetical protein n=1 Tax=uncultured Methanobrevibacter sp. TaxID=253161 RepID=UPI0025CEBBDD|nr:hypothetical protein [uncultured Methanobrevibacter sp.]